MSQFKGLCCSKWQFSTDVSGKYNDPIFKGLFLVVISYGRVGIAFHSHLQGSFRPLIGS